MNITKHFALNQINQGSSSDQEHIKMSIEGQGTLHLKYMKWHKMENILKETHESKQA